ncbi:hypothetical protein AVEN_37755-1 [Araneus ventricosus]|uniref:Uncharacterized protein n=1 Tax=Araneus ventricosus TaxID=182803 RepID=A0A4Y2BVK2_ARAVE|nr:hypothetical protein AVEN_37755-1 [Araneus ventricosus]
MSSSSETEGGVLIAITGHGPTSPAGSKFRQRSGGNSTHTIAMPTREERTHLLIRRLLVPVLVLPPPIHWGSTRWVGLSIRESRGQDDLSNCLLIS